VLNIIYTQNVLHDSFSEILKPYELSSDNTMLRILRGQKGQPANMFVIQGTHARQNQQHHSIGRQIIVERFVTREVCPETVVRLKYTLPKKDSTSYSTRPKVVEHEEKFAANLIPQELVQLNELLEKFRTK
jgi:hypothetical protein